MQAASKYMGQNLVKSETLPNIALPNNPTRVYQIHTNVLLGVSLLHICARSCGCLATIEGARSLFYHTLNLVFNKCQTTTQVVSRYNVPIPPYSLRNRPILCIVPFGRRISLRHGLRRVRKPILSRSVAALLSGCVWSHLVSMTNAIRSLLWAAPLWSCERQKSRVSRWSGSRSVCVNPATFNHTTL